MGLHWDIPNDHKEDLRRQGDNNWRCESVTDINLGTRVLTVFRNTLDELAREWYLPIPVSDRDYVVILVIALLMVGGSFWLVLPQYTFPR